MLLTVHTILSQDCTWVYSFTISLLMSIFFVSEYCLWLQMALVTVPGGEARTMVSPQPSTACCTRRARRRGNTPRGSNVPTARAQAFLMDYTLAERAIHYTTQVQCGLVGDNDYKFSRDQRLNFPKHGGARDNKFLVTHYFKSKKVRLIMN
jgi:hypothetical protein